MSKNEPASVNGIECIYRINQERIKMSGDNKYSRYVPEFNVISKSECNKFIPYQTDPWFLNNSSENLIATLNILNASGRRFTSKDVKVYGKPWWVWEG